MRTAPINPTGNQIPPGLHEEGLSEALEASGYPLQGLVSQSLLPEFYVLEEWGFIDRDTGEHRSLDLYAYHQQRDRNSETINPSLTLLIECKRSAHPFVFFKSVPDNFPEQFPAVTGLPADRIKIQ